VLGQRRDRVRFSCERSRAKKRLCASCRVSCPPIYIQYYFRSTSHVSPSHIHLSTPRRYPFTPLFRYAPGNRGIVAEYTLACASLNKSGAAYKTQPMEQMRFHLQIGDAYVYADQGMPIEREDSVRTRKVYYATYAVVPLPSQNQEEEKLFG
jgi:hypothetical protein